MHQGRCPPADTSMRRICIQKASHGGQGEVLYVPAPGMGRAKTRPCLVLGASGSDVALLPLSSDTWNPKVNPSLYFNDGLSFAVLDRTFTLPWHSVADAQKRVISGRAVTTCIKSLRSGIESGRLKLPGQVLKTVFGALAFQKRAKPRSMLSLQEWNNRS